MDREYLIIPELHHIKESMQLAEQYGAAFEYNDFTRPTVYDDREELNKRVEAYLALPRDRSRDTMHGAFFDVIWTSMDPVIRNRSRQLVELSLDTARRLGVRGVVFHTGLIGNLRTASYLDSWLDESDIYWHSLLKSYDGLDIYLENTFETTPDMLLALRERMSDQPHFKLCLDYGHAALAPMPLEVWIEKMAPYVAHIHLNDNDLVSDLHLVPGEGKIDFSNCCKYLKNELAGVPILLELNGLEEQRRALEYMKSL